MRICPPGFKPSVSSRMLNMHFCSSSVLVISRQTVSIEPWITTRKTALSPAPMKSLLRLDAIFHFGHATRPQGAVLGGPAVINHLNRNAIEIQPAAAPFLFRQD